MVWDHRLVELWEECRERREERVGLIDLAPRRPVVFHAIVTPLEGEEGAVMVLLQDLTRVRELETVRRDFVANVSHELRTPLATLKALVETLQEGALEDPHAARRFLEQVEGEVERLDRLVGELLELARIESGRTPLQMARVAVADVVGPPVEGLRPLAQRKGLSLTVHLSPTLPLILADVDGMRRVVANLVHNAIQFTPSGEVTVRAERVEDEVVISVRDTGVGIPPEDLPRVFERFYKARGVGRAGRGWGWRSPNTSSWPTAGASGPRARRGGAARPTWRCRWGSEAFSMPFAPGWPSTASDIRPFAALRAQSPGSRCRRRECRDPRGALHGGPRIPAPAPSPIPAVGGRPPSHQTRPKPRTGW